MNRGPEAIALTFCLLLPRVSYAQDAGRTVPDPTEAGRVPDLVFIPTPHDVVLSMLKLAGVQKSDVVYDLGCGDGRIVVMAAQKYGCRAVGIDIDPNRVKQSRDNVRKSGVEKAVTIEHRDLFKVDLRRATVVTVYLSAHYNSKLIPQFETLKPGSRIVSHQFDMRGVKPDRVLEVISREDGRIHTLYLWTTPLKKRDGRGVHGEPGFLAN